MAHKETLFEPCTWLECWRPARTRVFSSEMRSLGVYCHLHADIRWRLQDLAERAERRNAGLPPKGRAMGGIFAPLKGAL